MTYETPQAFRSGLEQRLQNRSAETGLRLDRLRRGVLFERIVARLEAAAPGSWVLKGGMALEVRLRGDARVTKDIDLGLRNDIGRADDLREFLRAALGSDPDGDLFEFDTGTPRDLADDGGGHLTWRVKVAARLAGRPFGNIQLDISPRAHELHATDRIELPNSLGFAGIPSRDVEIVDINRHAAEKFHGMLRTFGDRENSRVRDLVDVVLLVEHDLLTTDAVAAEVRNVWSERDGLELPAALPPLPDPGWAGTSGCPPTSTSIPRPSPRPRHSLANCGPRCSLPRRPDMPRSTKAGPPASPQAKLASVIKSARDAMRKDAGLNGDIDRIPQLAWLLFLKAFDGLEENREITDLDFRPAIEAPYRWRDWAADRNGPTGEALLNFVNGKLLPYLRELIGTGSHDPRDVLAAVFKETNNRMLSGYLLRDVINKVNEINFASADDIHTMAHLYESMLREMRDAAGDSGEFYTPRPVIRFMVQQVDPRLGEVILDPACGTGGFLVEALGHLAEKVQTAEQRRSLHTNLRGIEKKPLPYLLGMMNLVLHDVGQPNITRANALARPITQISRGDRVDVVLTNPPFGGEEERCQPSRNSLTLPSRNSLARREADVYSMASPSRWAPGCRRACSSLDRTVALKRPRSRPTTTVLVPRRSVTSQQRPGRSPSWSSCSTSTLIGSREPLAARDGRHAGEQ